MDTPVKVLLLGAVAYVVYEMFFVTPAAASTTAPPYVGPTPTAPVSVVPLPESPPVGVMVSPGGVNLPAPFGTTAAATLADANFSKGYSPTVAQMLTAFASGSAGLSADQWNYYYSQLSGVNQTYEMLNVPAGTDRATVYSVQGYLALRSTAGLSGMGRTRYVPYADYRLSGSRARQWGM